jgi:hypothetical protein
MLAEDPVPYLRPSDMSLLLRSRLILYIALCQCAGEVPLSSLFERVFFAIEPVTHSAVNGESLCEMPFYAIICQSAGAEVGTKPLRRFRVLLGTAPQPKSISGI